MHPWVGSNYDNQIPRVLILGLSVYGGRSRQNRIQDMIESVRQNEWTHAFFTKVLNAFNNEDNWFESENGKEDYTLSKDSFWNNIAFYEYLLHVFKTPKERVDTKYYEEAKEPFIEVVNILKPDIVLCMGFSTYDNLPEMGEYFKTYECKGEELEVWNYKFMKKTTFACRIKHPSNGKGFKPENWSLLYDMLKKDIGY